MSAEEKLKTPSCHNCAFLNKDMSCTKFNYGQCTDYSAWEGIRLTKIDDGGTRQNFSTGAVRESSSGKGRFDLITPYGLDRLAHWYEQGAKKYADRNWEKGIPASRCLDSALRHLTKYMMGKTDEDHLAAAAWNIFAIMHYEAVKLDVLDLPIYIKEE